ncbi:DUF4123 domain-containing protein, partial [Serratia microhaemolytica]|uniref:DUF4123 domain-containing protein n=1 Tax=Serratia microhaemolytica TaxID=2675110 RepID=UPI0012D7B61B
SNTTGWSAWLCRPQQSPLFFILNNLAQPNPLHQLYYHDWVEQAFGLYQNSPLQHLVLQGPWLVQVKITALPAVAALLQKRTFSDESWGWVYRSQLPWQAQIAHWQQHNQVILRGRKVVLRWMDTRILARLLPAFTQEDWGGLLYPVDELMYTLPESETAQPVHRYSPLGTQRTPSAPPFVLGPHLIQAWEHSPRALENQAVAIACELWEEHGALAAALDTPDDALHTLIMNWLQQQISVGYPLPSLTHEAFLAAHSALINRLTKQGVSLS